METAFVSCGAPLNPVKVGGVAGDRQGKAGLVRRLQLADGVHHCRLRRGRDVDHALLVAHEDGFRDGEQFGRVRLLADFVDRRIEDLVCHRAVKRDPERCRPGRREPKDAGDAAYPVEGGVRGKEARARRVGERAVRRDAVSRCFLRRCGQLDDGPQRTEELPTRDGKRTNDRI
ncbi:MAG: hypothetical protein ACKVVT_18455 [Dehalococcoidia bacterium]